MLPGLVKQFFFLGAGASGRLHDAHLSLLTKLFVYVHECFKGLTIKKKKRSYHFFFIFLCTWRDHVRSEVNCPENLHVFPPVRAGGARVLADRYEHLRLKILKVKEEAATGRMLLCRVWPENVEAAFLSSVSVPPDFTPSIGVFALTLTPGLGCRCV